MFQTRITRLFGIQYPILMGGMAHLGVAELVAAVANAGGLGFLTAANFPTAQALREEIRKTRQLTNKPFGVNLTLFQHPRATTIEDYMEALIAERVTAVETAGRNPEPYMPRLKAAGVKVIHKTPAVRFARTAEKVGADAVAILGFEGAGHIGRDDVASLVLIPKAAESLKVPVVAAGGVGDHRGFVAALALGAEGVLMGTRFVATRECIAHPKVKEWILQAQETDTTIAERTVGNPLRAARNKTAQEVLELEAKGTTEEEIYRLIRGERGRKAWLEGDLDGGLISLGEVIGLIRDLPTVQEVISSMIEGAQKLVEQLHRLGQPVPLARS